jgi:hypothetical protein
MSAATAAAAAAASGSRSIVFVTGNAKKLEEVAARVADTTEAATHR